MTVRHMTARAHFTLNNGARSSTGLPPWTAACGARTSSRAEFSLPADVTGKPLPPEAMPTCPACCVLLDAALDRKPL